MPPQGVFFFVPRLSPEWRFHCINLHEYVILSLKHHSFKCAQDLQFNNVNLPTLHALTSYLKLSECVFIIICRTIFKLMNDFLLSSSQVC